MGCGVFCKIHFCICNAPRTQHLSRNNHPTITSPTVGWSASTFTCGTTCASNPDRTKHWGWYQRRNLPDTRVVRSRVRCSCWCQCSMQYAGTTMARWVAEWHDIDASAVAVCTNMAHSVAEWHDIDASAVAVCTNMAHSVAEWHDIDASAVRSVHKHGTFSGRMVWHWCQRSTQCAQTWHIQLQNGMTLMPVIANVTGIWCQNAYLMALLWMQCDMRLMPIWHVFYARIPCIWCQGGMTLVPLAAGIIACDWSWWHIFLIFFQRLTDARMQDGMEWCQGGVWHSASVSGTWCQCDTLAKQRSEDTEFDAGLAISNGHQWQMPRWQVACPVGYLSYCFSSWETKSQATKTSPKDKSNSTRIHSWELSFFCGTKLVKLTHLTRCFLLSQKLLWYSIQGEECPDLHESYLYSVPESMVSIFSHIHVRKIAHEGRTAELLTKPNLLGSKVISVRNNSALDKNIYTEKDNRKWGELFPHQAKTWYNKSFLHPPL